MIIILALKGVEWVSIPFKFRSEIMKQLYLKVDDVTDQGIANILWGLAKMHSRWDTLPESFQMQTCSIFSRLCMKMSPQALANSIYSLGKLKATSRSINEQMFMALELSIRKVNPSFKLDIG
jgi:hypothetical protein